MRSLVYVIAFGLADYALTVLLLLRHLLLTGRRRLLLR
jgi:hypothetical protein